MRPQSKFLSNALDWARLLASWRTTVTVGSAWNLVRLIRSSWGSEPILEGGKRSFAVTLSYPVRRRVKARLYTSDILVLEEVFRQRTYAQLVSGRTHASYIIDCGANVGYASIFFLQRFPGCRIFAIEPDEGNLTMCRLNLASEIQQGQVRAIQAAAWTSEEVLALDREGKEWGFRVVRQLDSTNCLPPLVRGYSLAQLIELSGFPYVDILKIDIEGAELPIFRAGLPDVLVAAIRTIIVELHGPESADSFYSTLRGKPFSLRQFGNYAVAENNRFSAPAQRTGIQPDPKVNC